MKMIEAVLLSNALCSITNKNLITNKEVRLAVINNAIALMPVVEPYDKQKKAIYVEFSTEEIKTAEQNYNQSLEAWKSEKDEDKKNILFNDFQIASLRLQILQAPFEEDMKKATEKINEAEVKVPLDLIKAEDFDAATEKLDISIKDIIALQKMFIPKAPKEKTDKK